MRMLEFDCGRQNLTKDGVRISYSTKYQRYVCNECMLCHEIIVQEAPRIDALTMGNFHEILI